MAGAEVEFIVSGMHVLVPWIRFLHHSYLLATNWVKRQYPAGYGISRGASYRFSANVAITVCHPIRHANRSRTSRASLWKLELMIKCT